MAEKDEIKIPQGVFDRANAALRRDEQVYNTGSVFTQSERNRMGVPQFPFGGRMETSVDNVGGQPSRTNPSRNLFGDPFNNPNVQYDRDRGSLMANRYTLPTTEIARQNMSLGSPFGDRFSATSNVNPRGADVIEAANTFQNTAYPIPSTPNVGNAGFGRNLPMTGGGMIEQTVSPYGFAQTTLTPQQQDQRATSRASAEQAGLIPRTPEQQQAALDRIRQNAATLNQQRTDWVTKGIQDRKQNTPEYTTPSGAKIVAPTNQFGQPIQSFADIYSKSSPINEKRLADIRAKAGETSPQPQRNRQTPVMQPFPAVTQMTPNMQPFMPPPSTFEPAFSSIGRMGMMPTMYSFPQI